MSGTVGTANARVRYWLPRILAFVAMAAYCLGLAAEVWIHHYPVAIAYLSIGFAVLLLGFAILWALRLRHAGQF